MRQNGAFRGVSSTVKSLEDAQAESQAYEQKQRQLKEQKRGGAGAAPASPPAHKTRRTAEESSPELAAPCEGSGSDDDPLAYIKKKARAKSKAKAAKGSMGKLSKLKPGSPMKQSRSPQVQKKAKGKASGQQSKQQQLAVRNEGFFTDVLRSLPLVLERFPEGKIDKTLIGTLLANCNIAIAWFANTKHLDVN